VQVKFTDGRIKLEKFREGKRGERCLRRARDLCAELPLNLTSTAESTLANAGVRFIGSKAGLGGEWLAQEFGVKCGILLADWAATSGVKGATRLDGTLEAARWFLRGLGGGIGLRRWRQIAQFRNENSGFSRAPRALASRLLHSSCAFTALHGFLVVAHTLVTCERKRGCDAAGESGPCRFAKGKRAARPSTFPKDAAALVGEAATLLAPLFVRGRGFPVDS